MVESGMGQSVLLRVENLHKDYFPSRRLLFRHEHHVVRAVDGVSFDVAPGETFGLVGESGCGKSTIARCILRLTEPTAGEIFFDGIDVRTLSLKELRRLRRRMQIVFQDPFSSLDPRMSVRSIVEEPLVIHGIGTRRERGRIVEETLETVGLLAARAARKPNEFSGGERQRIALARALILEPDLVILDEAVSALDVSIQAQVLNLLADLQERLGLTYIFIVHDLAVAEYFCDRMAVLYLGRVMETAPQVDLFREPLHPYTRGLLAAAPIPDPVAARSRERVIISGEAIVEPEVHACVFQPRCPVGRERSVCRTVQPTLAEQDRAHLAACHFPGEREKTPAAARAASP